MNQVNSQSKGFTHDVSILIVSFNTKSLLSRCLQSIKEGSDSLSIEVIVIDNASSDGSAEMVTQEWPEVRLIESSVNLGFAAANNVGFRHASGEFIVLLNTDAFLSKKALYIAVSKMRTYLKVGLAGGKLVGENKEWQPSGRMFPTIFSNFLMLSGLAHRYSHSPFFGYLDRTWTSPDLAAEVDWVPGAFSIIRRQILDKVGYFDERFFLYYEEVDLCVRIKASGYSIWYWPDIEIIHLGGQSASQIKNHDFSKGGAQLTLWRMRSALLYFRKHHGCKGAFGCMSVEIGWHIARLFKVLTFHSKEKRKASIQIIALMWQAWRETRGGRDSPPKPW